MTMETSAKGVVYTEAQLKELKRLREIEDERKRKFAQRIVGVKLTLIEQALGMSPPDPAIHEQYIASKAPDKLSKEEEVAAHGVEAMVKAGMTIFPKMDDGTPFAWSYQLLGAFKEKCGMLRRVGSNSEDEDKPSKVNAPTKSGKLSAHKKILDSLVHVYPRHIPINRPDPTAKYDNLERPIRAQTAQGERVALANSEIIEPLSTLEFEVWLMDGELYDVLVEWLEFLAISGLFQWRGSGGYGKAIAEVMYDRSPTGGDYVAPAKAAKAARKPRTKKGKDDETTDKEEETQKS
jgi:hypothetical protein